MTLATANPRCRLAWFRPEHLDGFEGREHERAVLAAPALAEKLRAAASHPFTWTGFVDGRVAAIGGVLPLHPGVAEAWMLTGPLVETVPLTFVRIARDETRLTYKALRLHRLQALVRSDRPEAIRLARIVGFRLESVMRRFGPDREDFTMMTYGD